MPQFPQRFGFNLPDTLASHGERLPDFFQRVLAAVFQTKAHLDDPFLARRQRAQHLRSLVFQVDVDHSFSRRNHAAVFDEIAQVRIFLFANRRFERDRLLRNLQDFPDLGDRNVHPLSDFFRRRFASQFLHKLPRGADQLVDRFDHVDGDTNRTRLISNCTSNCLPNPPRGISRKLIPAAVFEFVHGLHQADVAFLNQVEELQTPVGVLLGYGYDQAEVGFDQFLFGLLGFRFAAVNQRERTLQFGEADFAGFLNILQFGAACTQLFAGFRGDFTLGNIRATLEPARLALKRLQALDGAAHFVDQALLLKGIEVDVANSEGN